MQLLKLLLKPLLFVIRKIRIFWWLNSPRLILKCWVRNKVIREVRNQRGIPENFDEITKEFLKGENPGFLLKYPSYFFWKKQEAEIKKEYGVICKFKYLPFI